MRAVVQRVTEARVEVDGRTVGEINAGLLVLLGVARDDSREDAQYLVEKSHTFESSLITTVR
jgi:D-tyrosyl-tRNA(Tyr) deacylase